MHGALPLVAPGRIREDPAHRGVHLAGCVRRGGTRESDDPGRELPRPRREVLAQIVEHLGAQVRGRPGPARLGLVGCLHRVPDVLAVPGPDLGDVTALPVAYREAVAGIGPDLLAADVELVG